VALVIETELDASKSKSVLVAVDMALAVKSSCNTGIEAVIGLENGVEGVFDTVH
jgi:hypothetical protein